MSKLSVVIITKNAEDVIADCLDSVSFADEIIVVDSDSTDRTAEIAKMHGAKVVSHPFKTFSDQRNVAIKKAKSSWVFYLDADERVDTELRDAIKEQVEMEENPYNAFTVRRKNFYLGNNQWPVTEKLERLFKKKFFLEWYGDLHESPKFEGKLGELDGFLLHYTHRDLRSMLEKTITWSGVEAKLRYDAHHPKMAWWRFPRVMAGAFYDSYIKQEGYTIGIAGLIESLYQAFSIFVTYARLWEMQQSEKRIMNHES